MRGIFSKAVKVIVWLARDLCSLTCERGHLDAKKTDKITALMEEFSGC